MLLFFSTPGSLKGKSSGKFTQKPVDCIPLQTCAASS